MSQIWSSDLLRILQIIWLDLLLSGDNAIVIALACRQLPERQRKRAAGLGALGAIALRVIFAVALLSFLRLPYLNLAGGLLLVWIALALTKEHQPDSPEVASSGSLWSAVRVIIMADALMSLDNVLAITAAARGDPWLVLFGLVISLPLVVFGAALVLRLLQRAPWLLWASAALIGWSAGEMAADDPALARWGILAYFPSSPSPDLLLPACGAALVLAVAGIRGLWRSKRKPRDRA